MKWRKNLQIYISTHKILNYNLSKMSLIFWKLKKTREVLSWENLRDRKIKIQQLLTKLCKYCLESGMQPRITYHKRIKGFNIFDNYYNDVNFMNFWFNYFNIRKWKVMMYWLLVVTGVESRHFCSVYPVMPINILYYIDLNGGIIVSRSVNI